MKKLILKTSVACFLSILVVFSPDSTLFAQASVPGTSQTNTGANTGTTATVPGTDQTNTGANTGTTATVPGTDQTNTGANAGATEPDVVPSVPKTQSGGGSGGSFLITYCSSVTYEEWGAPINGYQYRDVINQIPVGCSLTVLQQEARSRKYPVVPPQILGVKYYPDGSLLRGADWKIYIIIDGRKKFIKNWGVLCGRYKGQEIFNVSYEVLAQYPEILGVKVYADGSLLRGPDKKIYLLVYSRKQHIKSSRELTNYKGRKIYDVSYEVLAQYPEVLGAKAYADGSLLRGLDKKVYLIVAGRKQRLKTLKELSNYKGRKIYDVSYEVLAQYPEVLGGNICGNASLFRGPDQKMYLIVNGKRRLINNMQALIDSRCREIIDVDQAILESYQQI